MDISDLREQHTQNVILDSLTEGVLTVDSDWRIVSFNRAAEEITGVERECAVGRPCWEVMRSSICARRCALRSTLETGRPSVSKRISVINAEGRRIAISMSTAVLRDRDGKVIGGVESFRDMSLVEVLRRELEEKYSFSDIIGRSPAMRQLFDTVPTMAQSESTILIEGASGTGKELFARALHDLSPRREMPFVAINCGALPDTLLESELFGFKAGAFTDARRDKPGKFVAANGGTIFLDEIGDVSPAMQSRLLRVLQERVVEPLGSVATTRIDVRVIAATNKGLEQLVREGKFRQDLYYRINVIPLKLPLLRDRVEDIPLLVEHFISKFNGRRNKDIAGMTDEAMQLLSGYSFPGNVRELENIIEHAFVLCNGWFIEPRHLPVSFRQKVDGKSVSPRPQSNTLAGWERVHIVDALRRHGGNRKEAARELGINPSTLFRKIRAMDIALPVRNGRTRSPHKKTADD